MIFPDCSSPHIGDIFDDMECTNIQVHCIKFTPHLGGGKGMDWMDEKWLTSDRGKYLPFWDAQDRNYDT